jgi:hypothetical protein
MKALHLPWALVLIGCSSVTPPAGLTAEQASARARALANAEAHARYGFQPYVNGAAAKRVGDQWVWFGRTGCSYGDLEATVKLAADGSPRTVQVNFLDSRAWNEW